MSVLDDLLHRALELPEPDRATLARRLLLSLEPEDFDDDSEAAWATEIAARLDRVENGQFAARDWREVIADLQKALSEGKPA